MSLAQEVTACRKVSDSVGYRLLRVKDDELRSNVRKKTQDALDQLDQAAQLALVVNRLQRGRAPFAWRQCLHSRETEDGARQIDQNCPYTVWRAHTRDMLQQGLISGTFQRASSRFVADRGASVGGSVCRTCMADRHVRLKRPWPMEQTCHVRVAPDGELCALACEAFLLSCNRHIGRHAASHWSRDS